MNGIEAGPEADAMAAEQVMGWPQFPYGTKAPPGVFWFENENDGSTCLHVSPEDLERPWEVVEQLKGEGFNAVVDNAEDDFCASFVAPNHRNANGKVVHGQAHAAVAPLAICRAALEAVNSAARARGDTPPEVLEELNRAEREGRS